MSSRRRKPVDWPQYLGRFHAERPAITEAVLTRCEADGEDPYRWLLEGIDPAGSMLDLACGSAPTRISGGSRWVGIDRSMPELAAARCAGGRQLVRGDATVLPFASGAFDSVVCAMALMLVAPVDRALHEMARVLRAGGSVKLLLPAHDPMQWSDRIRFAQVAIATRATPQFPESPLAAEGDRLFEECGFRVVEDRCRRFGYRIETAADAARLVDSLYLPNATARQLERAKARARRWCGSTLGIPLRKITLDCLC